MNQAKVRTAKPEDRDVRTLSLTDSSEDVEEEIYARNSY